MKTKKKVKLSRLMSYLLRHNPEGLEMSEDGFVALGRLVESVQSRYPWATEGDILRTVESEGKGRYELFGDRIRARYGHSFPIKQRLSPASPDKLYHGTTEEAAGKILAEGLKPMRRQKVHLSSDMEEAVKVGKRRTRSPTILEVDAARAVEEGVVIERATDGVYVADYIPPRLLSKVEWG